ncbi:hypothetical protein [Candidatus Stoquefichus massiliensis]|uniref:anti-sigma-I factor RsgI family protein n=1 Tax=Candidatus Stoquefichus massiliensis TaxID=1470350 RepID=UPI0004BA9FEA|nr:hypothetical protein [Candidatus Stoquefichus massiliensis]
MNNPLQELNNIHASQTTKEKTLHFVLKHKHHHKNLYLIPVIACLLILLFIPFRPKPSVPVAYVSLDINPSLELRLDQDNIVLEAKAYNKDAKKILKTIQLQGQKLETAIINLLNDKQYKSYLQDGLLEISVFADNQNLSTNIETTLNDLLKKNLEDNQYHCRQVTQETHHNASSHHMTAGKYQIIETIMSYTSQYSLNELKEMTILQLYTILYTFNQEDVPTHCQPTHNQENHHQNHH